MCGLIESSGVRGACGIVGERRGADGCGSLTTAVSPGHVLAACVASLVIAASLGGVCVQNGSGRLRASPGAPPPVSLADGPLVARGAVTGPRSSFGVQEVRVGEGWAGRGGELFAEDSLLCEAVIV